MSTRLRPKHRIAMADRHARINSSAYHLQRGLAEQPACGCFWHCGSVRLPTRAARRRQFRSRCQRQVRGPAGSAARARAASAAAGLARLPRRHAAHGVPLPGVRLGWRGSGAARDGAADPLRRLTRPFGHANSAVASAARFGHHPAPAAPTRALSTPEGMP